MKLWTKLTVMLLTLLVLLGAANVALAAKEGDFEYRIENSGAIITKYTGKATELTIPATLGGKPVTSVGKNAFKGCSSLTSITLPNSVTTIGDWAFSRCSSLTSITIPDSVTSIGYSAFEYCTGLTSVTIPDSVTSVGNSAFMYCAGLTSVTIPNSVTSISSGTFTDCTGLTSITIPDSVTSIGIFAFSGCSSLTSVVIPDSVTSIGMQAFQNCQNLTCVTIPDSVTTVDINLFYQSPNIRRAIVNPDIAGKIRWPEGALVGFFDGDFCYRVTDGQATLRGYDGQAAELTIPSTLGGFPMTAIYASAFRNCTSLTSVTIPDCVTSIEAATFMGCTSLTTITIPDAVTSIGKNAFNGCTSLTTITIPDAVTSIGSDAFKGCTSLTAVNTGCAAAQSYPWPAGVRVGLGDGDFSFVAAGDTAYCLMSYSGDASVVIVPSTYNGKPVTQIDSGAFGKSVTLFVTGETPFVASNPCWRYTVNADGTFCLTGTNITDARLILPGDACGTAVTAIGDYAFMGKDMSFVYIPDSIVTVVENPFRGCTKLATIVVNPENAGLYVSAEGALYSKADKRLVCFPAGLTANRLTIPAGVRSIGAYAMYLVQTEEIVLPDSVTVIGEAAFAENDELAGIVLPEGLAEIPARAFYGCGRLADLTLPTSLTGIGESAFYDCDGLLGVILHGGLQTIGAKAFAGCNSLQLASIPASVTSIGAEAFSGAPLLTLQVQPGSHAATYARENLLHALYPDSDSWLAE